MEEKLATIYRLQNRGDAQNAYCCMTEVPTPWPQALCQCREWLAANLGKYVEGYHLRLSTGEVIGHLYFAMSEQALFPYELESDVGILYCDWVQQNYQGMGFGKRLFDTFVDDMRQEGAKGILVEATDLEGQMFFQHYLGRGFEIVHEKGHRKLLYYPLRESQVQARPLQAHIQPRSGTPVEIVILNGYLCPYEVSTIVRLREIAPEFGKRVILQEENVTPKTLQKYGFATAIFINGRQKLVGGETEEAIRQAILEEFNER